MQHMSGVPTAKPNRITPPYPTQPYPGFIPYGQKTNHSSDSLGAKIQHRIQVPVTGQTNSVEMTQNLRNDSIQSGSTMNSQFSQSNLGQLKSPEIDSIDKMSQNLNNMKLESPDKLAEYNRIRNRAIIDMDNGNYTPEVQLTWVETLFAYTADEDFISHYNINGEALTRELSPNDLKKNELVFVKTAVKLLKKIVSETHLAEAQFILGSLYSQSPTIKIVRPNILEKNYEKSFLNYRDAAAQSHPIALYRLGVTYELGIGTSVNEQKSLECFTKSANLGYVSSMFKLGMIYSKGLLKVQKSAQNAIPWFIRASKLADSQNPHALYELAKFYERDAQNVDHDFLRMLDAIKFPHSEELALNYYKEAAKFQHPPAQCKLGYCYEYGKLGLSIDPRKSIGWYSRSANNGSPAAAMALSGWYLTGAKGLLEPNDKEAFLWALKSANSEFVKAEYALGYYYEVGLGCQADPDMSRKYYIRAANQGHEKAIEKLKRR